MRGMRCAALSHPSRAFLGDRKVRSSASCAIVNRFVTLDGRRMLAIEAWADAPSGGLERSFVIPADRQS